VSDTHPRTYFVTGATGLVGRRVLQRLLAADPFARAFVLVRDAARWREVVRAGRIPEQRAIPIQGDLTRDGLGIGAEARRTIERTVDTIVHAAADTVFSRPLETSRRVNLTGTANVVDLAEGCSHVERIVHVSTAFVAGRLTGDIHERMCDASAGFVNSYEQSKWEAEQVVRASSRPWIIVRPSTIVCDEAGGRVSQFNAVHRALRLHHAGLAAMLPGHESNPVDFVTADYVADCIDTLARTDGAAGGVFHVCAGSGAMPLGRLLEACHAVWSESARWRRRAIALPAITDVETYRLFERSVEQTGDARLRAITRSLSHFVPQLALPKRFDTTNTDRVTRRRGPAVAEYWAHVVRYLVRSRWAAAARRAA
jgi:long-chain acyl-CoA synthetase